LIIEDARLKIVVALLMIVLRVYARWCRKDFYVERGSYFAYGLISLHNASIIEDARLKIVDAPLMLILKT